jgi:ABC-type transport system involved in cytochrome bd biosynthesis fused ATPase/permease subunit
MFKSITTNSKTKMIQDEVEEIGQVLDESGPIKLRAIILPLVILALIIPIAFKLLASLLVMFIVVVIGIIIAYLLYRLLS